MTRRPKVSSLVVFALAITAASLSLSAAAQTFETLYDSAGGTTGAYIDSSVIFDQHGNLFGLTLQGGNVSNCFLGCGTVFEMSPKAGGGWSYTTIYQFLGGNDGDYPVSALVVDSAGNLYGETNGNGSLNCPDPGCGTVFELSPNSGGGWTKTILHSFQGSDGSGPHGGLALGPSGNLYGVTTMGGGTCSYSKYGCGTLFELSPQAGGAWKQKILHRFGQGKDGYYPFGAVLAKGKLYGTTQSSPASANCTTGCGIVFQLAPNQSTGAWSETIAHVFEGPDGENPAAPPTLDAAGNIYGTTGYGGSDGNGVVYKLEPVTGGSWKMQLVYQFSSFAEGAVPYPPVVVDSAGNIYGTTEYGGNNETVCLSDIGSGCGVVYRLTPGASGIWNYSVLYSFTGGADGNNPMATVVLREGGIFGTTSMIQQVNSGTVFKITP